MIVVTVELWPMGDRNKRQIIGTAEIANKGTGTQGSGNYHYVVTKDQIVRAFGEIRNFPRQKEDCWNLLKAVLENYD